MSDVLLDSKLQNMQCSNLWFARYWFSITPLSSSLYDKVSGSNAVYHLGRNQPSIPPVFKK
jgi:hypothetical protein